MHTLWNTYKIGDIGDVVGGATPSTKNEDYYGGNIPWLTPKDLSTFSGRYIGRGERNITPEGLNSCSARLLPKNSVLFTSRAPIGYIAIAENDIATNQGFKSIIPNEKVDYLFLYYLLKYNKEKIEAHGSGTTFKEVSGSVMKNIEVFMPSLKDEQRAIADTLSCLDEKIELNNRMNKTLEEMAQVIFKRCFVDYEFPNEDGHPYKSSGGAMTDSELGEIPQRWRVGTLDSCCNLITKGITPKYNEDSDELVINQRCIRDSKIDLSLARRHAPKTINEKWLVKGDILINSTGEGTLGRVAQVNFEAQKLTVDSHVTIIRPNAKLLISYLGAKLCGMQAVFERMSSGSTGQTDLPRERLKNLSIVLPDERVLLLFSELYRPLQEQIAHNQEQNQTLTTVRDALLPKLMSGEIRVKGV